MPPQHVNVLERSAPESPFDSGVLNPEKYMQDTVP